jgi:hypothetical protein
LLNSLVRSIEPKKYSLNSNDDIAGCGWLMRKCLFSYKPKKFIMAEEATYKLNIERHRTSIDEAI